ncbi:type II toxin-antitoxin system PemK/MazF family toxin [Paenibacillus odorifer]|uniref:type II toxin-antitoxin system PemK/MazF family toxin n=1 Tax=Paenibacillus odorifer TaxID=189426 RepID=UPI0015BF0597|nr:type II toxin-antitoxin system PemK/MazF family toxin [Paenibacillus odorifer]
MTTISGIKRGDVFLADLGNLPSQKSSVQRGFRPVVIISNNINNKYSPTVNIVPLSTAPKKSMPMHVRLSKDLVGLDYDSIALCEQTSVLDKSSLSQHIVTLGTDIMRKIENCIVLQYSIGV